MILPDIILRTLCQHAQHISRRAGIVPVLIAALWAGPLHADYGAVDCEAFNGARFTDGVAFNMTSINVHWSDGGWKEFAGKLWSIKVGNAVSFTAETVQGSALYFGLELTSPAVFTRGPCVGRSSCGLFCNGGGGKCDLGTTVVPDGSKSFTVTVKSHWASAIQATCVTPFNTVPVATCKTTLSTKYLGFILAPPLSTTQTLPLTISTTCSGSNAYPHYGTAAYIDVSGLTALDMKAASLSVKDAGTGADIDEKNSVLSCAMGSVNGQTACTKKLNITAEMKPDAEMGIENKTFQVNTYYR